jgi:putative ABC transport system substrate-binding protein
MVAENRRPVELHAAAHAMGLQVQELNARSGPEIDVAFTEIARRRADALFVASGPFLVDRRVQLALLAAFQRIPAVYSLREHAEAVGC